MSITRSQTITINIEKELDVFIDEQLNKHFRYTKLNFLIAGHIKDLYLEDLLKINDYSSLVASFKEVETTLQNLLSP